MDTATLPIQAEPMPVVAIGGGQYYVGELSPYHFLIRTDGRIENGVTYNSVLKNGAGEVIESKIRTRVQEDGIVNCRFNDMPLQERRKLECWIKTIEDPGGSSGDNLNQLSYDEIASGDTGAESKAIEKTEIKTGRMQASAPVIVFLLIIVLMAAFVGGVFLFAKTKNQIKINHGALVGNYVPVQAAETGIIKESLYSEGELVKKGDVLFTLGNSEIEEETTMAEADLDAALAKVAALESLIASQRKKFDVAVKNSEQNIVMANALHEKARIQFKSQKEIVDSLSPLVRSRIYPKLDYQKERRLLSTLEAEVIVQEAMVSQAMVALDAMVDGEFFIMGQNIDDQLNTHRAELGIAMAEVERAKALVMAMRRKQQTLNVRAPHGGRVFAVYRTPGEYVKLADPVLSLSKSERSWAFGSVEQSQAHRVRPGQMVRVEVTALNEEVYGKVASVGHRSVYTEGGWSQDFKVDPLSIPIKVWLPEIPHNPPTGIRLKMMIKLPFRWPWQEEDAYDPNSVRSELAQSKK